MRRTYTEIEIVLQYIPNCGSKAFPHSRWQRMRSNAVWLSPLRGKNWKNQGNTACRYTPAFGWTYHRSAWRYREEKHRLQVLKCGGTRIKTEKLSTNEKRRLLLWHPYCSLAKRCSLQMHQQEKTFCIDKDMISPFSGVPNWVPHRKRYSPSPKAQKRRFPFRNRYRQLQNEGRGQGLL